MHGAQSVSSGCNRASLARKPHARLQRRAMTIFADRRVRIPPKRAFATVRSGFEAGVVRSWSGTRVPRRSGLESLLQGIRIPEHNVRRSCAPLASGSRNDPHTQFTDRMALRFPCTASVQVLGLPRRKSGKSRTLPNMQPCVRGFRFLRAKGAVAPAEALRAGTRKGAGSRRGAIPQAPCAGVSAG